MEPVLTRYIKEPNSHTLDFSVKRGAYEGRVMESSLYTQASLNPSVMIATAAGLGLLLGWALHSSSRRRSDHGYADEQGQAPAPQCIQLPEPR